MKPLHVVVCAYRQIRLSELADLARRLAGRSELTVSFYLYEHLSAPDSLLDSLQERGVEIFSADPEDPGYRRSDLSRKFKGEGPLPVPRPRGAAARLLSRAESLYRRVLRRFRHSSPAQWLLQREFLHSLRLNYRNTLPAFRERDPDIMLLLGDRHRNMEPVLIRIARDTGARIVIPYLSFYAEPEELRRKSRVGRRERGGSLYTRLAQRRYADMARGGKYFYEHWEARALECFGTLSRNPWVMGAGEADALCLPSEKVRKDYLRYDIPPVRLKVTGDIACERLWEGWSRREELRAELDRRYGLQPGLPLIVLALPQLAEHGKMPWDKHWEEIERLVGAACQLEANTVLSLHPKMNRGDYDYLEERFGCRLLDERLVEALPAADFFIASFSSTVLWATLCGIPSAVVDYGFGYDYYDDYQSIDIITRKDGLVRRLKRHLSREIDFSGDWERLSRERVFFGRTIDNYVSLFRELG